MEKYLSPIEREKLLKLHRSEKDRKKGDRIKTVLLADDGWSYCQIARALFINEETASRHVHDYHQDHKLKNASGGSESKLDCWQSKELVIHLTQHTYMNAYQIMTYVEEKYGVTFSHSGMVAWLHQHKFSYKAPARVPAKSDSEQQKAFIRDYNKLKDSLPDDAVILFGDGVHPTMETKLSAGWIKTGVNKPVKTTASRTRINLFGAINLVDLTLVSKTYQTIDSESVSDFMVRLKQVYPKEKIHLVLDQGSYNRSNGTLKQAKKLNIEIHLLPPYSPNLNPIERCWKVMNEQVRNNVFFRSPADFKGAINDFFVFTWEKIKPGLFSRINDNFQPLKSAF